MAVRESLEKIFVQIFDLDDDVDVKTLKYRGIEKWDSLTHMELILAIEEQFGIVLDPIDVLKIDSFESAVSIVTKKYDVSVEA